MIEIISVVAGVLGLLLSLVLFIFSKRHQTGNWLLGISLLLLWYCLIVVELYRTGDIYHYAHFSRTGNIAAFLITPFLFFFTQRIFTGKSGWIKKYWWAFVPPLFYFLDFLPYFFLSLEEKRAIIQAQQLGNGHFVFSEGMISPNWFQYYLRFFWELLFLFLTIKVVWDNKKIVFNSKDENNQKIGVFILGISILYAIALAPGYFLNFFVESSYNLYIQSLSVSATLISTTIFMIFNPNYLYGFYVQKDFSLQAKKENEPKEILIEEKNSGDQSICEALDKYLRKEKSFKNPTYSIHDLSKDVGIPVYKISPAINSCYGTNFNTWLNGHRIKEFEEMIGNGAHEQLSLEGISANCGFANRTTFTNSCKKITGHTPGNFLKLKRNLV